MVTGGIQQPYAVRPPAGHPPRSSLGADVRALAGVLAVPLREARWRERLILRLAPVRAGFADHVRVTEGPAGRYAELLGQAPRLDRGVRLLTREHAAIAAGLAGLQRAAELPGVPAEELRGRAGQLLRAMSRHRQRGADLIWQAYQTDLGGET
ncbi:hypothetical protein AB0H57_25310 [Micromonospora sp. NPDC050686]|uniref:hypothetical protein n=1 Tax=Micromonospora sp. NPDC050686 TaxID=3154631 RepID=UPI0033E43CCE